MILTGGIPSAGKLLFSMPRRAGRTGSHVYISNHLESPTSGTITRTDRARARLVATRGQTIRESQSSWTTR